MNKTTYNAALQKALNELQQSNYGVEVEELTLDQIHPEERAFIECRLLGIPAWLHSSYKYIDN